MWVVLRLSAAVYGHARPGTRGGPVVSQTSPLDSYGLTVIRSSSGSMSVRGTMQRAGIAIRHSRDPDGPALIHAEEKIAAFIRGARDGDFDHLLA